MIVEITSLTPRVTLSTPAMPAQSGADEPSRSRRRPATLQRRRAARPAPATAAAANDREAVLALDADVEQVHPEADGHRERGEVVDGAPG